MDLYCFEDEIFPEGFSDPTFLDDHRLLTNLRKIEPAYQISCSYFNRIQTEVEPHMRKEVAGWMLDVCCSEQCEDEVFPMAINVMDRFLSLVDIRKSQFQLLGCVCLLLSSKLRESRMICAERLIIYTDYSVTIEEIKNWEMLVLCKLKWDLSAITPMDFLNLLLRRLRPIIAKEEDLIRKHSQIFIALCSTDDKFIGYPPSLIAAASIKNAIERLSSLQKQLLDQLKNCNQEDYVNSIANLVISNENVRPVLFKLSTMIEQCCKQEKGIYFSSQLYSENQTKTTNKTNAAKTKRPYPMSPPTSQNSTISIQEFLQCSQTELPPSPILPSSPTSFLLSTSTTCSPRTPPTARSPICSPSSYSEPISGTPLIPEQVK